MGKLLSFSHAGVLAMVWLLAGCAGPTSPFGAVEFGTGDGRAKLLDGAKPFGDMQARPRRQVLHRSSELKLQVRSEKSLPSETELKVFYNGKDVSSAFRKKLQRRNLSRREQVYTYQDLRLRADRKNQVDIFLSNGQSILGHLSYLPPECEIATSRSIASVEPFRPPEKYLSQVNRVSQKFGLNPSLLAGLIAQESAFDPEAVSTARAVGLTQITPLADQEIARLRPEWPRDSRLSELSSYEISSLVRQGRVTSIRDWRLNPSLAIEGGALYISYLRDYWRSPDGQRVLSLVPAAEANHVILASYNSGPARVKNEIERLGDDWLKSENLKEAFRYVQSVSSYCYHFAEGTP